MAGLIALAGCNSSTTPSTAASPSNISGDYTGTMQDAQAGSSPMSGTLAQHGNGAGGSMLVVQSGQNLTVQMALNLSGSNALNGSMVIDYPSGTTCTFSTTGSYSNNGTAAGITGTYKAVTNCSGDTGSYTLSQQCTDTITSARRRMNFPVPC